MSLLLPQSFLVSRVLHSGCRQTSPVQTWSPCVLQCCQWLFTGVFWTVIAAVTAEVVGSPKLPSALSSIWLTIVPSTMFAQPITLAVQWNHPSNPFIHGQLFISIMFISATIPMLIVREWKVGEAEKNRRVTVAAHSDSKQTSELTVETSSSNFPLSRSRSHFRKVAQRMFARQRV